MAVRLVENYAAMAEFRHSTIGPIAAELTRAAVEVETQAKRLTAGPGTGRAYARRGVTHIASAPGEPFATDTGRLRASITHSLQVGPEGLVALVGSDVEYAGYVETGTSRMAARPYLRPAAHALSALGAP